MATASVQEPSDAQQHQPIAAKPSIPLPTTSPNLESLVNARHSTRVFLDKPVPEATLSTCLRLAQRAPSNSNIQPWRLKLASGAARDRIVAALSAEAEHHGPQVPPLLESYNHFRSAMGAQLYGPDGYDCARSDKTRHRELQVRNFAFFGAPVVGVVYMDTQLTHMDAMTVGMFMQTFNLALVERGLACCWQVSVTGFPEVLAREFGIDGEVERMLCGVAVGWPDLSHPVNLVEMGREGLEAAVTFLRE